MLVCKGPLQQQIIIYLHFIYFISAPLNLFLIELCSFGNTCIKQKSIGLCLNVIYLQCKHKIRKMSGTIIFKCNI